MKRNNFSDRVIKFIITRSNDELGDLTIAKITCMLKMSRSHLYQQFKDEKKFTPGEYLVMIKMLRSAYMLVEDQTLPIEKIAHKMGFSSTDYFKKVFRAQFGTTPGQYRNYARQK